MLKTFNFKLKKWCEGDNLRQEKYSTPPHSAPQDKKMLEINKMAKTKNPNIYKYNNKEGLLSQLFS